MIRAKTLATAVALSALILGPLAPLSADFGAAPAFAKGNGGGHGGGNGGGKGGNAAQKGGKSTATGAGKVKTTGSAKKAAATTSTDGSIAVPPNAHGKMASELKGLNAYHASETAFANASPNSQVGRIAAYREAALGTIAAGDAAAGAATALEDAMTALGDSEQALADLDAGYTGRTTAEIDTDIAGLDPTAADYQSSLDTLNAERLAAEDYETQRTALEDQIATNETAVADAETALADAETALADAQVAEGDALTTASNGRVLSDPAIDFLREQLGL